jgi:hypothetical protein
MRGMEMDEGTKREIARIAAELKALSASEVGSIGPAKAEASGDGTHRVAQPPKADPAI